MRCTLTLAELLKVKPQMWKDVGKCLEKMGVIASEEKFKQEVQNLENPKQDSKPVPLNKVGEYCEGEDGNTTLPIEYKGVKTVAILDSGAVLLLPPKQFGKNGKNQLFAKRA